MKNFKKLRQDTITAMQQCALVSDDMVNYVDKQFDKIEEYIKEREKDELEFLQDLIEQNAMMQDEMIIERISDLNEA